LIRDVGLGPVGAQKSSYVDILLAMNDRDSNCYAASGGRAC
jgi:hypothetical protein